MSTAYLLLSHGSRDPRPQVAVERLAELLTDRLSESPSDRPAPPQTAPPLVGTAQLDCAPEPLHRQVLAFADRAGAAGCDRLRALPLFLSRGVHVAEDIPREMAIVRRHLPRGLALSVAAPVGLHPRFADAIARHWQTFCAANPGAGDGPWLLVAHGSRRPGGNAPVERQAQRLGAIATYWSVAPSLRDRLAELDAAGHRTLGVMPYVLFAGNLTDGLAEQLAAWRDRKASPQENRRAAAGDAPTLYLAEPIGPSADLVALLVDWAREPDLAGLESWPLQPSAS